MFDNVFALPPNNMQAEMALLGSLLADNRLLDQCGRLAPEHFIGEQLGEIFGAIQDAVTLGRRADGVTLQTRFDRHLLVTLLAAAVAPATVPPYAKAIFQAYQARELVNVAQTLRERAYSMQEDPAVIAAQAMATIDRISQGVSASREVSLDEALDAAIAAMDREHATGVSTGFSNIDARLGLLEPGLVYVLAGRPRMGKSSLAHQICLHAARSGVGVLELSLEMSSQQLARRAMAAASGVPLGFFRPGLRSVEIADKILRAREELRGLPLYIDDAAGQTPSMVAAKARAAKRKHKTGLVMIDHLNLMRPDGMGEKHGGTWAVERASATVLEIAKECETPVVLCVQLNRGPDNREDHRPHLSDLRQSGSIEQDAFAVGFVYRPEVYLSNQPPEREAEESAASYANRTQIWHDVRERSAGRAELIWEKNRDGEEGTDFFRFDGPTTSFREIEQ